MFETEAFMQDEFCNVLDFKTKQNESLVKEFNGRFGNVDIVKISIKNKRISQKQIEIISKPKYASTLAFLHKKGIRTLNYLINKTSKSKYIQRGIINTLIENKIVIEVTKNCFLIDSDFEFPKVMFSSYELKLKDWRKALSQAIKNLEFSSSSYVVMPREFCENIFLKYPELNKTFCSYGIGLLSFDNNGKIKIIIRPRTHKKKLLKSYSYISAVGKALT